MTRRVLASALAAVLLTGACTVNVEPTDPDPGGPSVEQFREQNAVDYDLTSRPTAQELGVPEGRDSAIFDRDGSQYWDVSFTLPGGSTFTTGKAIAVGVFISDPPGGLLNSVGINVRAESEAELADLLRGGGAQLGLDPAEVERYLDNPNRLDGQVLHGRAFGYLMTSVELRPQSARPGVVALNYTFVWEPGVTGASS